MIALIGISEKTFMLSQLFQTSGQTRTHTHTCSELAYRIIDVERTGRAKTPQLNLTGVV